MKQVKLARTLQCREVGSMRGLLGSWVSHPPGQLMSTCHTAVVQNRKQRPSHCPGLVSPTNENTPEEANWHCLWQPGQPWSAGKPCQPITSEIPPTQSPARTEDGSEDCSTGDMLPHQGRVALVVRRGHRVGLGLLCTSPGGVPSCWARPSSRGSSGY